MSQTPADTCRCKPKTNKQMFDVCICGYCGHLDDGKDDRGMCSKCGADCWVQRADICNPDLHDYVWSALFKMSKILDKTVKRPTKGRSKAKK